MARRTHEQSFEQEQGEHGRANTAQWIEPPEALDDVLHDECRATHDAWLRCRLEELETIFSVLPIGIAVAEDRACTRVRINPALADVLTIDPQSPQTNYRYVRNGVDVPQSELPLEYAAATGEDIETELDVELANGQTIIVWQSARPLLDAQGDIRGSVCVTSDITDRKREALAAKFLSRTGEILASALTLPTMFDTLGRQIIPQLADVYIVDLIGEGGIPFHAAVRAELADGTDVSDQIVNGPPIESLPEHPVHDVLRTGVPFFANVKDGALAEKIWHRSDYIEQVKASGLTSLLIVPLEARGRLLGTIALGTLVGRRGFDRKDLRLAADLARRVALAIDNIRLLEAAERAREDAQRANRAKSDFLATMSHELRTPLNAIAGYTQLMQLGLRGEITQAQRDDLDRIAHNQRHLLGLINSVLNFAKVDAGSLQYHIADISIEGVIHSVEPMIAPQMRTNGLRYRHDSCPAELFVRADEEKLRQIVLNLLSNAVKFTPSGGEVTVACSADETHGYITVTDTGIGIPANKLDRIFEPFMQIDRTLSTTHEGVGLGLAISRDLARGMLGDITVRSSVESGTTFTVTLPKV